MVAWMKMIPSAPGNARRLKYPTDSGFTHHDRGRLVTLTPKEVTVASCRRVGGREVRIHAPRTGFRVIKFGGGSAGAQCCNMNACISIGSSEWGVVMLQCCKVRIRELVSSEAYSRLGHKNRPASFAAISCSIDAAACIICIMPIRASAVPA